MYGWIVSTPVSSSATVTPAPENPGIPTSERRPPAASKVSPDAARIDRSRNRRPDRKHAPDVGIAYDNCQRPSIERRGKPVEDAVVGMFGLDRSSAGGEFRDHGALAAACNGSPSALLFLGCDTAGCGNLRRQGRFREHDDPAPAQLGRRPVAEEALPAGGTRHGIVRGAGCAPGQKQGRRRDSRRACCQYASELRQPKHRHPGREPRPEEEGR